MFLKHIGADCGIIVVMKAKSELRTVFSVAAAFDIPGNLTPSFLLDVGYSHKGTAPSKMHFERREVKDFATYK